MKITPLTEVQSDPLSTDSAFAISVIRRLPQTEKKIENLKSAGRVPSLTSYTLAFALQLREKHGKNLS